MTKIILFFSLSLLSYSLFSQCADPTSMDSPQIMHASCPGQGQITVTNVLPVLSGADYFQYALYNTLTSTEVYTWQNSNVFLNLQAGTYQVRVRRRCSVSPFASTTTLTGIATINNTEINSSFSSVQVLRNARCNNGKVTAVALGSGPLEYALVSSLSESEPVATYVRPRQPTSTFDGLPAGNYFMRVYNACDNASTIPFTIDLDLTNTRVLCASGYFNPIGCDSVSFRYTVNNYFKNTTNFPTDAQVKSWVKWPNGDVDTINLSNQNNATLLTSITATIVRKVHISKIDPTYNTSSVWPSNLPNATYSIEYGMKDICGTIYSDVFTYKKPNNVQLVAHDLGSSSLSDCDNIAYHFSIQHSGGSGTTTSTQGFVVSDGFRYSLDGGASWTNATTSNAYVVGTSYTSTLIFPRGVSQTILLDYCGTIISRTFIPLANSVLNLTIANNQSACINQGRIRVAKNNVNGLTLGVRVLSVPAGQAPIPYFEIVLPAGNTIDPVQFSNLMPGVYSIEFLDTINVSCQRRITRTVTVVPFNFDFNYTINCNKNLEITSSISLGSVNNFRVKIFNNLAVQVFGGPLGIPGNTSSYLNIPGTDLAFLPNGTYTIRVGKRSGNALDDCSYIEKQWIKNDNNNLSLQNSIFVSGCADGFGALGAVATGGSAPYQYTLLDINDNVISPSSPGANTYNGLNTANVYKISVLDACGSVVNRLISSNSQIEIGTPGYTKMPCKGNSFALTLPQFSGVSYVWMKDGVVIPTITGNVLNFPNIQLSDSGTYQSIMTIGNCQVTGSLYINPDNCGGPLAVELTSFHANCDSNNGVVLKWITASELNSSEFILQKSPDLVNWTRVGVIPAKGNSNVVSDYTMLDRDAFDDVSYYQLIQRDVDGSERKYSPISNQCDNDQLSELKVYPNPNNGNFKVEYHADRKMSMELFILDVNGRKISSKTYHLQPGSNSLFVSEDLVQGMYILQVVAGKKILKPIKFIVE